jgi:hypothetical protein
MKPTRSSRDLRRAADEIKFLSAIGKRTQSFMAFPNLTPANVAWLAGQTQAYIVAQRAVYHPGAVQLTPAQTTTMSPFFAPNILGSTRLNVLHTHVSNPPFYPQLVAMEFPQASLPDFSTMDAITFIDTVVFQVPITDRTLFHELVHVVQYVRLGSPMFAAKYVTGFLTGGTYPNIPLEVNAYQLDAIFAAATTVGFSVEDAVQACIDAGQF